MQRSKIASRDLSQIDGQKKISSSDSMALVSTNWQSSKTPWQDLHEGEPVVVKIAKETEQLENASVVLGAIFRVETLSKRLVQLAFFVFSSGPFLHTDMSIA